MTSISVEDKFEQYLLAEAWRAGLRKPEEVSDYVDYWRTTPPAQRVLAGMRIGAGMRELAQAFGTSTARMKASASRLGDALKNLQ